tara:strand:+ start:1021 stop:1272 length:252 start_codon:yes stop_codon:yes gene_type:complete
MTAPIRVKYIGSHFSDLTGEVVGLVPLAKRLEISTNTARNALHNSGAIERGYVEDCDLGHYLPDKATINKQNAALELMCKRWG